jgi:uncharacterized delta-60 repeat protein
MLDLHRLVALASACLLYPSCKVYDPLYCDVDRPCEDPERPFCDLNGEYPASEGIKKTCIPQPAVSPAGDFAITPVDASVQVRAGGELAVELAIDRRDGFAGEITIVANGLPAGITADPVAVDVGATAATLLVEADDAEAGLLTNVTIRATSGELEHTATLDLLVLGPAGSLDPTFGSFGLATEPYIQGIRSDDANGLIQLADGSLMVGGDSTISGTATLFRFRPAGTLDTTFGQKGLVSFDFDRAGVQIQPQLEFGQQSDGKVVVAATGGQSIAVGRFNGDGIFDDTFEGAGMFAHPSAFLVSVGAVAIGPRDEILVGVTAGSARDRLQVIRFQPDGAHDEGFAGGLFDMDRGDLHDFSSLHVLPDGSVVGMAHATQGDVRTSFVFKTTAQGALDPAFGAGGVRQFAVSENVIAALALEGGAILVAGFIAGALPASDPTFWRLTSTGDLDRAFGSAGKVQLHLPAGRNGAIAGMLPTAGGQVLAFGSPGITLIRLDPSTGALDASFGEEGIAIVDLDPPVRAVAAVRRADGRVLVLADEDSFDFAVARFFE